MRETTEYEHAMPDFLSTEPSAGSGCRRYPSREERHTLQDGQNLGGLVVIDPFVHTLAELGLEE